jgi:hypothetical protein
MPAVQTSSLRTVAFEPSVHHNVDLASCSNQLFYLVPVTSLQPVCAIIRPTLRTRLRSRLSASSKKSLQRTLLSIRNIVRTRELP